MGARFDRLRCEVFQNLFLSPMNTGFVRPAVATVLTVYGIETDAFKSIVVIIFVATVLTVYGIETHTKCRYTQSHAVWSQQYLPFTVLKPAIFSHRIERSVSQQYLPFTVLKRVRSIPSSSIPPVATVLTVYGIETLLAQLKFSRYH